MPIAPVVLVQLDIVKLIVTLPPSLVNAHHSMFSGDPPEGQIGIHPVVLDAELSLHVNPFNSVREHNTFASSQAVSLAGVHWLTKK